MTALGELASQDGVAIPKYSALPALVFAELDALTPSNGQPAVPFPFGSAAGDECVRRISAALEPVLAEFEPAPIGPVLKTSYLANNAPVSLSFAGVGDTATVRPAGLTAATSLAIRIMEGRHKPYSQYYRAAHPEVADRRAGLLLMGFLPGIRAWGTAWSCRDGMVVEAYSVSGGGACTRRLLVDDSDIAAFSLGDPMTQHGLHRALSCVRRWATKEYGGQFADVEFCVLPDGEFSLTQWRPIPRDAQERLTSNCARAFGGAAPPPYSDRLVRSGRLRRAARLTPDVGAVLEAIDSARDEIWLVDYYTPRDGVGLFELLEAASLGGITLPPLVAVVSQGERLGHLHAVAIEDPAISCLAYARADEVLAHDGARVVVSGGPDGYARIQS